MEWERTYSSSIKCDVREDREISTYWCLRISAFILSTFAALIVVLTSAETTAFKYLSTAYGIIWGGSLLSTIDVFCFRLSTPHPDMYLKLFVLDLAMTLLMVVECAVGTAIAYVDCHDQTDSIWFSVCNKINISLVLSYTVLLFCIYLTYMAVVNIKSSSVTVRKKGFFSHIVSLKETLKKSTR